MPITPEQQAYIDSLQSYLGGIPPEYGAQLPFSNEYYAATMPAPVEMKQYQDEPKKKKKSKNFFKQAAELPFKAVREVAKPVVKVLPKGIRKNLHVIGAIGGSLIGGPLGGIAGGSLGGAARGGRHPMEHALGGAALGGLSSLALGGLGSGLSGGLGNSLGLGGQIAPGAAGIPSTGAAPGLFSGSGLFGNTGLMNSLIGGGGGLGTLLNTGLLATSIGGAVTAKKKRKPQESETLQEAIDRSKSRRTSAADWNRPLRERNPIKQPPRGYRGTSWNYFPTPEEQEEQLRRVNEEIAQEIPPARRRVQEDLEAAGYARGGLVKDYYDGQEGGQSDRRLVKVRPKSYIVNSTTVSLAGDGNSKNGAKVIKNWAKSFQNGHFFNEDNRRIMKAYVSDGELKLQPEEVMAIGEGDINNGVKVIKKMERGMRKHKGVNKFLPPKSKPLDIYAGIVR